MKRAIAITLGLAVLSALPATAAMTGKNVSHTVYNTTKHCAWVTIDTSNMISPWRTDGAAYIKPGDSHSFTVEARPELKARAQVSKDAACGKDFAADVNVVEKRGIDDVKATPFTISGDAGKFAIHTGKP